MSSNEAFDEDDDVKEERSKVNEIVSSRDLGEVSHFFRHLLYEVNLLFFLKNNW